MQLLGSSKTVIDKNKDDEIVPRLETVEVILVHCNLMQNFYLLKFGLQMRIIEH